MPRINILDMKWDSRESVIQIEPIFKTDDELSLGCNDWLINVFCYHPVENIRFPDPFVIRTLFASNIVVEPTLRPPVQAEDNMFVYHLYATVHDRHHDLVCIGDFFVQLDVPLPKDIHNGDVVSFDAIRLDWDCNQGGHGYYYDGDHFVYQ